MEAQKMRIVVLNSLPLNAFEKPIRLDVRPIEKPEVLLNLLRTQDVKCYIGHSATAGLLEQYGIKCERGQWRYGGEELLLVLVLRNRLPQPGEVQNITWSDLAAYAVIPIPIPQAIH
jgi:hypothetical protein